MTKEKWATVRKNLYQSLPQIQFLLGGTAIALSQEQWQAITALAAIWLLSPLMGQLAAANVDMEKAINADIHDYVHSGVDVVTTENRIETIPDHKPGTDKLGGVWLRP